MLLAWLPFPGFPKGSPLVFDMSVAILKVIEWRNSAIGRDALFFL
jgi:hypothetical protein